jgi:mycothiol synthase
MVQIGPWSPREHYSTSVAELLGSALPHDAITWPDFVVRTMLDPGVTADSVLVACEGRDIVGICTAIADASRPDRGYMTLLAVAQEHRGCGIGSELLRLGEARLASLGCTSVWLSPYGNGYYTPGIDLRYEDGLRFLTKKGYSEAFSSIAMAVDLWDVSIPTWVTATQIELSLCFGKALAQDIFPLVEFVRAEFPHWEGTVRDALKDIYRQGRTTRDVFVCTAGGPGGRVLGFSHFEGERFGPIGVAASEQGRGIGQVLMFKTLEHQRKVGLRSSWFMWSDDRTAERLYKSAGFREVRSFAVLKKELGQG